jgi:hypothetical protein
VGRCRLRLRWSWSRSVCTSTAPSGTGPSYLNQMREFAPYDIDNGANLAYFIKWDNGGWGYRKRTWQYGPLFVPTFDAEPESLAQVIDRTRR